MQNSLGYMVDRGEMANQDEQPMKRECCQNWVKSKENGVQKAKVKMVTGNLSTHTRGEKRG